MVNYSSLRCQLWLARHGTQPPHTRYRKDPVHARSDAIVFSRTEFSGNLRDGDWDDARVLFME